ncbi:MAG: NAD(P)/FAD-dependent oxidoreductase, partial [Bacteroidetes bacterium]|nr:NAD(P)/FAD-dependent oxidoreductase [Bacteroidota bacterium]
RVSGGGRCNVTHACFEPAEMIKNYPRGTHFVKKAFHQFFTTDTIEWFSSRGVTLKTEADGRMFPVTDSSQTIIDCLLREANRYGVQLLMNRDVTALERSGDQWQLQFANGERMTAQYVCVACGGYPKSSMFDWLRHTGHHIEAPVPSLFTFNMPGNPITKLMGVSVAPAQVRIAGTKLIEQAPLLITHWGMSGPVVLRLSAWGARTLSEGQYTFTAMVNWLPEQNEQELRTQFGQLRFELARQKIASKNPFGLPQRLWEYLLELSGINAETRWADLPAALQNKLIKNLCAQELPVKGKTTFKEEFVTAGGIRLSEVDPSTMMSRLAPNLHFAGEILDVDGVTGGFNFQHAWTSGWIAANAIAGAAAGPA